MDIQKRLETSLERAMSWAEADRGVRRRRAGVAVRDGDIQTLTDLLEAYLLTQGRAGLKMSKHTQHAYGRAMRHLMDWCGTHALKPHNINADKARNYSAWLQHKYSDKTVNIYLTGARQFIDALSWAGLSTDNNPFTGLSVIERVDPRTKADPYTKEELKRMVKAGDVRDQAIILLAADAGLRLAEIAGLNWSDVDFERKQLDVTGKGRRRRKPGLTGRLVRILRCLKCSSEKNVVIQSRHGTPITRRGLQWLMKEICKRAEVNHRGIHNLRHTCGTRLYEATRDLQAVARHLGHSTTKTSELYAHLADSDYRAAIDALDENGITDPMANTQKENPDEKNAIESSL